jgi:hypothetical protein
LEIAYAVGVAADVVKHLFRAGKGRLGVNHPLGLAHWGQVTGKGAVLPQFLQRGEELQLAAVESGLKVLQEEAAEQA